MEGLIKRILGEWAFPTRVPLIWKKSFLTVSSLLVLILGSCLLISCSLPRLDFTFEDTKNDDDKGDDGGGQGGGTPPAPITLQWDPNSEPDLAGYKVHYGEISMTYDFVMDVGNQTSYTITGLDAGKTYYFAATAYNTAQVESNYSNEITYDVPL